jgi:hypothetical protein
LALEFFPVNAHRPPATLAAKLERSGKSPAR